MTFEEQFSAFWEAYPNKKGKADAMKAFKSAIKTTTIEKMIEAIRLYKAHKPDWMAFKHPGTWLRAGCWDDEWEQKTLFGGAGRIPTREEYMAAEARRVERSWH